MHPHLLYLTYKTREEVIKMISWYWIIVAILVSSFVTITTDGLIPWEDIWCGLLTAIFTIIAYIPYALYCIFLRNVIHPVSQARFDKMCEQWVKNDTSKVHHLFGNFYFWIDPDANKPYNKIFFVRVKKSIDN